MDWNSPTTKKHIAEAQGCELVGSGKSKDYRTYSLQCGHQQEVLNHKMRSGGFRCQTCLHKKKRMEADAQGCELLGPGNNHNYRTYRLAFAVRLA